MKKKWISCIHRLEWGLYAKMKWSELSPMQIGRYAEYYAKMEFIEINILTKKDTKCAF